jgi:hypothetical protein
MKKISLSICLILVFYSAISQNYTYIGTNRYEATKSWYCTIPNGWPDFDDGSVSVAKNGSVGFLVVTVQSGPHHPLIGDVYIYLDDGNVIKCIDRGKRDQHDRLSIGIYNLTSNELKMLKKASISSLRVSALKYSIEKYSFTLYLKSNTSYDVSKLFP